MVKNAVAAIATTGSALLGKQLEDEPPVDVSSSKLEMKVRRLGMQNGGGVQIEGGWKMRGWL